MIYTWPIGNELSFHFCAEGSLVRQAELLQDLVVHCKGDHQTAVIHNEVVIEGKLAANVPEAPALFQEMMSVL